MTTTDPESVEPASKVPDPADAVADGPGRGSAPELTGAAPADGQYRLSFAQVRERTGAARHRFRHLQSRIDTERRRWPMLDMGFDTYERDHGIGGGVLGGALAFRLFLVALPALLAGVAALGFVAEADAGATEDLGRRAGLAESAVKSLSQSARLAQGSRWTTMILALVLMLMALRLLVKSLRVVQALAWQVPISKVRLTRALPAAVGVVLVVAVIAGASAWLRARTPGGGVGLAAALIVIWFVPWAAVMLMLPRAPESPWTVVLPGAFVLSVGTQLLHAATIYYFSAKIPEMSEIYGPLGLAAVALLWLYVVGRTFVAASVLNATIWNRRVDGKRSFPERIDALFEWLEHALGADPAGPKRRRGT